MADLLASVQAILAVPGALESLRSLTGPAPSDSDHEITRIATSLTKFSIVGDWFSEAKSYHDALTHVDGAAHTLYEYASEPVRDGGFNHDKYNSVMIVRHWSALRNTQSFIPKLVSVMERFEHYSGDPLILSADRAPMGDAAFVEFVHLGARIDTLLKEYKPSRARDKEKICDSVDQFRHHIFKQIVRANQDMIDIASQLSGRLGELTAELRSRGFG